MKNTFKKIIAAFFICAMVVGVLHVGAVDAEAKKRSNSGIVYTDNVTGDTYVCDSNGKIRTGWIKAGKDTYYAHKSKSYLYPKGAVAKNTFRIKNGKMYYFDKNGKLSKKDSRYIGLNKDHSVHYVYMPGMIRRYRYNANHKRYQYLKDNGKWVDVGSQCYPYGMIDQQY